MLGIVVPFTLTSTGSDDEVNPPTVALHEYEPLFDWPIGLNCSWLEVSLNTMFRLSSAGVLPSSFSHQKVPSEPPAEHIKVMLSPAVGLRGPEGVMDTPPEKRKYWIIATACGIEGAYQYSHTEFDWCQLHQVPHNRTVQMET